MKIRKYLSLLCTTLLVLGIFSGCSFAEKKVRIGVSFGAGPATRWDSEKVYMEERASELDVGIEVRLNRTDTPKTQMEDCVEMIENGIDVLILMPRNVDNAKDILDYAKEKKVPVISYARVVLGEEIDLFVGYDSNRIGQKMGQFLTENVVGGDYLILRGDPLDNNALLLYEGAMRYIEPVQDEINILADIAIEGWKPERAKEVVLEQLAANDNQLDAILAPNDAIAAACTEALAEAGVENHVFITGMDAEISAIKRIVAGTQDMTIYMDLRELASTAVTEAVHMARGEKVNVNAEFDNKSDAPIDANLITGQVVTKNNLDKLLIESGYFTKEEVYGK